MPHPRTLDLSVQDVLAAVHFYGSVFDAPADDPDSSTGAVHLHITAQTRVRVIDEATHAPSPADREYYTRGRTPRLELRVDDIDDALAPWVRAGATVRCRLPGDDGVIAYAQVLDPHGHLWAFARADDPPAG